MRQENAKFKNMAREMSQRVKEVGAKADDLIKSQDPHGRKTEPALTGCPLTSAHMPGHSQTHTHTHTHKHTPTHLQTYAMAHTHTQTPVSLPYSHKISKNVIKKSKNSSTERDMLC